MSGTMSIDELAERTGETMARLGDWHRRGLIGESRETGGFGVVDLERVRLVRALLQRGATVEQVVDAVGAYADLMTPFIPRSLVESKRLYSLEEIAAEAGLAPDRVRALWEAAGLNQLLGAATDDDLDGLRDMRAALEAGMPEDALVQLLRVYGDALGRVADAETRLFHVQVHQRLRAQGLAGEELARRTEEIAGPLQDLVEPAVLYFHRKAWEQSLRDDLVTHVAEEAGLWPTIDATGQVPAAVGFVDLCGFTSLTSAMGDLAAAEVVDRFARMVREVVGRSSGQVVKQIGDGFMLLFPDVASAIRCGLALEQRVSAEPQFPSGRVGLHWGPVLYRDGDYVGASVNVAARVAAEAVAHQVLVTSPIVREAAELADIEVVPAGARRLKGVPEPVELFEARAAGAPPAVVKHVDPVCRMELTPGEVAARATIDAREHLFCSTACLQQFVAAPGRYATP
jgi:adenylate cyclase